jgi:heptosyltransferase-2
MATPMIRRIRELNPDAELTVMSLKSHAAVFEGNPAIDKIISHESLKLGLEFLRATLSLRSGHYDSGYILPNSNSSAVAFALGGVKERTGYAAEGRGWLLNQPLDWPGQIEHRVIRYLRLVDPDPEIAEKAKSSRVEMRPGEADQTLADELLKGVETSKAVAINPCSITPTRRWLNERFAQLSDRIQSDLGMEVVVVGGPSEEDQQACKQVAGQAGSAKITNLAGKTKIKSLAALLGRLRLLITCNTGTMHIASTAGTPMVILPGSSDIDITAPWGVDYRVIHKDLDCYPCWKNECPNQTERPDCMTMITVDDVFKEAASLLKGD